MRFKLPAGSLGLGALIALMAMGGFAQVSVPEISRAVSRGDLKAVREYFAAGGDASVRGFWLDSLEHVPSGVPRGDTLALSAFNCATDAVVRVMLELLATNGVDLAAANESGDTPLLRAVARAHRESFEFLWQIPAVRESSVTNFDLASQAARVGRVEMLKLLEEKGIKLDCRDKDGWTPLRWAISSDEPLAAEFLLPRTHKATIDRDNRGWTLLDEAVFRGNDECATLMIKAGGKAGAGAGLTFVRDKVMASHEAPEVTAQLERIGYPYAERYPDTLKGHAFARSLHVIKAFGGKLYLGAGNYDNSGPVPNAGPVPVIEYDPAVKGFKTVYLAPDEQIDVIRELSDGRLYIPGCDPQEGWELGNFYRRDANGSWQKFRTMPHGVHNFDIVDFAGRLFCCGYGIAWADDWEASPMAYQPLPGNRYYAFLKFSDRLFAVTDSRFGGLKHPNARFVTRMAVCDAKTKRFRALLAFSEELFPRKAHLLLGGYAMISRRAEFANRAYFIAGDRFYCAVNTGDKVRSAPIFLSEGGWARDIVVDNTGVWVLESVRGKAIYENVVWRGEQGLGFKPCFRFRSEAYAKSFARLNEAWYFGLAAEYHSLKNWERELSEDGGMLLRYHCAEER